MFSILRGQKFRIHGLIFSPGHVDDNGAANNQESQDFNKDSGAQKL